jgi:hypothetical protein
MKTPDEEVASKIIESTLCATDLSSRWKTIVWADPQASTSQPRLRNIKS